jgi:hypothetical protein
MSAVAICLAHSPDGPARPVRFRVSKSGAVRSLRSHGPRPPWNGASTMAAGGAGTSCCV